MSSFVTSLFLFSSFFMLIDFVFHLIYWILPLCIMFLGVALEITGYTAVYFTVHERKSHGSQMGRPDEVTRGHSQGRRLRSRGESASSCQSRERGHAECSGLMTTSVPPNSPYHVNLSKL